MCVCRVCAEKGEIAPREIAPRERVAWKLPSMELILFLTVVFQASKKRMVAAAAAAVAAAAAAAATEWESRVKRVVNPWPERAALVLFNRCSSNYHRKCHPTSKQQQQQQHGTANARDVHTCRLSWSSKMESVMTSSAMRWWMNEWILWVTVRWVMASGWWWWRLLLSVGIQFPFQFNSIQSSSKHERDE